MDPSTAGPLTFFQSLSTSVMSVFLNSVLQGMKLHPHTWSWWKDVIVTKNVCYGDPTIPEHHLDIYRPKEKSGASPVVLYIHGGGFSILSKDTHWMAALLLARQGYTVFSINYRLASKAPFPAALHDTFRAATWVHEHAEEYGADNRQWLVSGESAGGNLTLSLCIANCFPLGDKAAKAIFARNLPIRLVIPACGLLQVSDPQRYTEKKKISGFVRSRIMAVSKRYLQGQKHPLADPILLLESELPPKRPLPPMMSFVGTKDPILDDTRRLETALRRRDIPHEVVYYPKAVHGFHLAVWTKNAKDCWKRQLDFIDRYLFFQPELTDQDDTESTESFPLPEPQTQK